MPPGSKVVEISWHLGKGDMHRKGRKLGRNHSWSCLCQMMDSWATHSFISVSTGIKPGRKKFNKSPNMPVYLDKGLPNFICLLPPSPHHNPLNSGVVSPSNTILMWVQSSGAMLPDSRKAVSPVWEMSVDSQYYSSPACTTRIWGSLFPLQITQVIKMTMKWLCRQ